MIPFIQGWLGYNTANEVAEAQARELQAACLKVPAELKAIDGSLKQLGALGPRAASLAPEAAALQEIRGANLSSGNSISTAAAIPPELRRDYAALCQSREIIQMIKSGKLPEMLQKMATVVGQLEGAAAGLGEQSSALEDLEKSLSELYALRTENLAAEEKDGNT